MSATPESIENLSLEERRDLLARLLRQRADGRKRCPLSFAQARLWILDRLIPGNPMYNVPLPLRLPGWLDVRALERSLNEIVRRHETLRTTFEVEDGKPVQVVAPSLELKLEVVDLSGLPAAEREEAANRKVFEESAHSFDLAKGPLVRTTLLKLTDTDHIFLVVMHHIISDGWSLRVFHNELAALYLAYSRGRPSPLEELPIQYTDFTQWQAKRLSGEALERELSYWRSQLAGLPASLALPTDRPRPPVQSHRGALHTFTVEQRLLDDLQALARAEGATPFMVLLAAFQLLLSRYAGSADVSVGTPIAGRTRVELEGLIGFFVNTLVLRTRLSGEMSFRELLRRVREVTLGAYAHQEMPFERLVEELAPERDLSRNPLFQVLFTHQSLSPAERTGGGGDGSPSATQPVVNGTSKFDMTLVLAENGQGLQGLFEYNTDLFDQATVADMAERFRILLQGIIGDPDRRLSRLPLLREWERRDRLTAWSGPDGVGAPEQTVCELVAAHAKANPEAVAVIYGDEALSYAALESRVSRLAGRLRTLGLKPGALVGVCSENPAEALVAALAVMESGGVYLPLDPAEPAPRLTRILEDAGSPPVMCDEHLSARIPEGAASVLKLEAAVAEAAPENHEGPGPRAHADRPACVLYESGPAGVVLTHRALLGASFGGDLRLNSSDRVAFYPSPFGTAACLDLFAALAAGASLVFAPGRPPAPPRKLAGMLRDRGVTVLFTQAPMLERLAREFPWSLRTVRLILCDDRAALSTLKGLLEADVLARVYGRYCAAEAGGCCVMQPLSAAPSEAGVESTGSTAAGTRLYLLDTNYEPVPHGVPGEIYVGADALALGYHRQPARTAAAFVPDPHSGVPGARLYRTHDLARSLREDRIRHLPREDGRFFVRGVRVEPEEVEAALVAHPYVREAAVVAHDGPAARETRVTAHVVALQGQAPTAEELRRFLRERLPEAMLPADFTFHETLPRRPGGEVDRAAVARLADARAASGAAPAYVAPRNPTEERLADIWAKTFGVERVGVNDSFFRLGGHSLLATQVVARVSDLFEIELPLGRLFESPTVAELAKVVEQLARNGMKLKPPPIQRMAREAVRLPTEPGSSG